MREDHQAQGGRGGEIIPVDEAAGTVLAHDITEIRPGAFKGCAFRKGHIVRAEDIDRLRSLGREHLFVLKIAGDELHEDEAADRLARALAGPGVEAPGEPREGKINLVAARDGLLRIDREALCRFNMLGDVMCATLHDNTVVRKGQVVAGTRAIPLVVKREVVDRAVALAQQSACIVGVREMRKPRVGVVITGNEVYSGRIADAFGPVIRQKIESVDGKLVGSCLAPDDEAFIADRIEDLIRAGSDLIITTGGMSVDPDDVTRFAVGKLGAREVTYGSAVLPGAMFLIGELERQDDGSGTARTITIMGIPACGMYHKTTIFDLVLPRVLAGERIGRTELAELGHGGLCLQCASCAYPVCPFGKA